MSNEFFDLARLKRNWDRAASAPAAPLPERIARVPQAKDPYPEAERVLERISRLSHGEFPLHAHNLDPFLNEARALLGRLRDGSSSPPVQDGKAPAISSAKLRGELLNVLADLEDLFEVYSGIGLK